MSKYTKIYPKDIINLIVVTGATENGDPEYIKEVEEKALTEAGKENVLYTCRWIHICSLADRNIVKDADVVWVNKHDEYAEVIKSGVSPNKVFGMVPPKKKIMIIVGINMGDDDYRASREKYDIAETYITATYPRYEIINTKLPITRSTHSRNPMLVGMSEMIYYMSEADIVYFCKGWQNTTSGELYHHICNIYGIEKIYEDEENSREYISNMIVKYYTDKHKRKANILAHQAMNKTADALKELRKDIVGEKDHPISKNECEIIGVKLPVEDIDPYYDTETRTIRFNAEGLGEKTATAIHETIPEYLDRIDDVLTEANKEVEEYTSKDTSDDMSYDELLRDIRNIISAIPNENEYAILSAPEARLKVLRKYMSPNIVEHSVILWKDGRVIITEIIKDEYRKSVFHKYTTEFHIDSIRANGSISDTSNHVFLILNDNYHTCSVDNVSKKHCYMKKWKQLKSKEVNMLRYKINTIHMLLHGHYDDNLELSRVKEIIRFFNKDNYGYNVEDAVFGIAIHEPIDNDTYIMNQIIPKLLGDDSTDSASTIILTNYKDFVAPLSERYPYVHMIEERKLYNE